MKKQVFISHAGADSPVALAISDALASDEIETIIDREELRGGDSFLTFMEKALSSCDYCLLLWSQAASEGKYVQVEWEAALYKAIEESRRFLLIARLEEHPVPSLLGPRLRVDLFPDRAPGLAELTGILQEDLRAEQSTGRAVQLAQREATGDEDGVQLYVTSQTFARTIPVRWNLGVPAGVLVDRLRTDLGLPRQHDIQGAMGVRYEYDLAMNETRLSRTKSLSEQGVTKNAPLWLEVTMKPFAASDPVHGELNPTTFRGGDEKQEARRALLDAVREAGLGPARPGR